MVVSTVDPHLLVESLGKEKVVLMPLSEYQALVDRLKELENIQAMFRAKIEHRVERVLRPYQPPVALDSRAALRPVSLKGVWGPVAVDEDDFAAARRSLFKPLHDESL